jgi:hypothetical protein
MVDLGQKGESNFTFFYEIKLINCYFFTLNQSNQNRLSTILTLCQIFSAKK